MRRKLLTIGILAVCSALLMTACLSVFRQKQEARRQMTLETAERFLQGSRRVSLPVMRFHFPLTNGWN